MRVLPWEYAVRNLMRSPLRLALMVFGSALVVSLILASAGFVRGLRASLGGSGESDNVMILGAGSEESVERSEIKLAVASIVQGSVPGLKTTLGQAHVSPEINFQIGVQESPDAPARPASTRGITPAAFLVHRRVRIVEGRTPLTARDEVLVGRLAASRIGLSDDQLTVGRKLYFDNRPWTVVGIFEAGGTIMEAEIWAPLTDLLVAAKRETISAVVVTMDKADFGDLDLFAKQRLDLELVAMPEREYYAGLSAFFSPIQAVAIITAGLIALTGLCGGLNALYAAFVARVREMGTLQTLGYSRLSILLSLIQESTLASLGGALLAALLGVLVLDGLAVRFSLGAFGLRIDSYILVLGLLSGLALGVLGALPPAWRCLRLPITTALKTS
ncbi:MAG: FtsX-like permease family protein [Planctomycetes bacterium ADurb.Bin126]|nr:MAG: FtsX-like permease family protein [Planctomycetes bacterium ADurb.Bin126]HOD81905.1 ABC transporter permease [Phycisphaerae bacterium]HQL74618.1 ABC transporter permease [Phycisphaerae bacterium]